jgi:hypothetical protein
MPRHAGHILLGAVLVLAIASAWRAGAFEAMPTTCTEVSLGQIDTIVRPAGVEILDLIGIRDPRSARSGRLDCEARVVTHGGPLLLWVTTLDNQVLVWLAGQARF